MRRKLLNDDERELRTHDPLPQVMACLSCALPKCLNCVDYAKYRKQRADKKGTQKA